MLFHFKDILQHFTRVLVRRQLMKRQMFVRKLMFLVCCSFLVIWSINVLNTKCKLNCQNEFFGKPFLKSGNTGVYFMFWILRFIWRTFDMIIDVSLIVVLKGLCLEIRELVNSRICGFVFWCHEQVIYWALTKLLLINDCAASWKMLSHSTVCPIDIGPTSWPHISG